MVYLLCFDKKFKHAKHYIGFAENQRTFELRMKHHAKGNGSKLMAAVAKAGIGFVVARTWPDGDRNFERKLKNRKEGPRLCPHCQAAAKAKRKEASLLKAAGYKLKPVLCPVVQKFDETKSIFNVVVKEKPDPIATATMQIGDQTPSGEIYAKPESVPNPSRWQRIWSRLARLFRV